MFEWVKGNAYSLVLTLYSTNITLNNSAASYFKDVRWVMIGIDNHNLCLGIKPVSKNEIDLGLVSKNHLHKVSIGKGYARISNKMLMQQIQDLIQRDIDGLKVTAEFDEAENILIVDLKNYIKG